MAILGELIVSKYVAESITMITGRFGHEGLCQLCTRQFSATYLLTISSPDINKVAMSLYDIIVWQWRQINTSRRQHLLQLPSGRFIIRGTVPFPVAHSVWPSQSVTFVSFSNSCSSENRISSWQMWQVARESTIQFPMTPAWSTCSTTSASHSPLECCPTDALCWPGWLLFLFSHHHWIANASFSSCAPVCHNGSILPSPSLSVRHIESWSCYLDCPLSAFAPRVEDSDYLHFGHFRACLQGSDKHTIGRWQTCQQMDNSVLLLNGLLMTASQLIKYLGQNANVILHWISCFQLERIQPFP